MTIDTQILSLIRNREQELVEAAYVDYFEQIERIGNHLHTIPHCDEWVLHSPGRCEYCDEYPRWQRVRIALGIAFTGQELDEEYFPERLATGDITLTRPLVATRPCPATLLRSVEKIERWGGNVAR